MKKKNKANPSGTFFDRINPVLDKYDRVYFGILLLVTFIVSLFLYDPRVSQGGDDSAYILAAHDFLQKFRFPSFQAPLYPIVLSGIDAIWGMSLTAFKGFSMLCMMAFMLFTFLAFRKRIPSLILFVTLLLTSVNSHVLYFASQTYSESFYMMMQSLLPLVFFRFFIDRENQKAGISDDIRRHLLLALVLLGIVLSRNIGYAAFLAILAYFACFRQWKNAGFSVICFVAFIGLFQVIKILIWKDSGLHGSEQVSSFLNKDLYHPEYGRETITGFIVRFWENSNQYLSRFFIAILGIRKSVGPNNVFVRVIPAVTVFIYLLALTGIIFSYKKNRYVFFAGILAGLSVVVTFFIIHTFWNQERMVIPAFPLMVMILFAAIYYLLEQEKFRSFQALVVLPVTVLFLYTVSDTSGAIGDAQKLTNEYSRLTPDWRNYAQASAWAGKNLPEDALVACRKPSISTIYARGKRFYGIHRVVSGDFNDFVDKWETGNKNYVAIIANRLPDNLYVALLPYYEARAAVGDGYFLFVDNTEEVNRLLSQWPDIVRVYAPVDMKEIIAQTNNKTSVFFADSLLAPLRRNHVTHILAANLRLNPYVKDGLTINTIERTAAFIQEKYPGIFTLVKSFGNANDEPAEILQINWEVVDK